ncbi:uncharacterized protein [Venturia canescens]|uniref:uncharacterized protein n=1 Tax=Venturia canescens TaxID=32260 RepID=UPI001C9CADED|nr:uncharacterized protein LOC122417025 [Venturia canescens]XP_043286184.1 uncharacterized protein LOC122417025 [Venturia canescens]
MTPKAALCHILVIWGLAQVTAQINRGSIPAGVRSPMIANGWRPLTSYEPKSAGVHLSGGSLGVGGGSLSERNSAGGAHPVHGKLQEHMSKSEKLSSKQQNKQTNDYNPPSILGSFSVFGNSVGKTRGGEAGKSQLLGSETQEYSFLVPPPREPPLRYEIEPYRKQVILRDNEPFLRQPSKYVISHSIGSAPGDIRNVQYFAKGGAAAVSASTHALTSLKNRPVIGEFGAGSPSQQPQQQQQQQHVPFESLKLSNTKLFLQPPGANGPPNFGREPHQPVDNVYERFPSAHLPHTQQLTQESSGNFYSRINHPSPGGGYKAQNLERDPSLVVNESHDPSYPTPGPAQGVQPGFAAFGNFRPSPSYEYLHSPERYSSLRPVGSPSDKFVPSKPDNTRQKLENFGKYGSSQSNGNPNLDNSIAASPEPPYSKGIINTYYISEQQSLTPPPPAAWSVPSKLKLTSDINEVLPKPDRPAKFNLDANGNLPEAQRQNHQNNIPNYLFPRPEVHQQHQHQYYPNSLLPSINEQPEGIYETPESISLKHFNEQQYRLQQQLLQRDRERLREQQLQRQQQQIELGRITGGREREKSPPIEASETPRPTTVEYYETTVPYARPADPAEYQENLGNAEEIRKLPEQQYVHQEYEEKNPSKYEQPDLPVVYEAENTSSYPEPEKSVSYESTEVPSTGHRTRPRKPATTASSPKYEQQHRRRKPVTPTYEEATHQHQEERHNPSTLSPNPIVQSPGSPYSLPASSETPTTDYQGTSYPPITTGGSYAPTIITTSTTTPKPTRARRPSGGNAANGRRRRPASTTTEPPETVGTTVTYRQEDYTKYERVESDSSRRRKPTAPPLAQTPRPQVEIDPTTSTEKKRFEIQNYGHKLGANEHQDYLTEVSLVPETYPSNERHVPSSQQSYNYGNEKDASLFYTPGYEEAQQVTTIQDSTDYGSSDYPTSSSTSAFSRGKPTGEPESVDDSAGIVKNVYTNVPLEELFVNTERVFTTTTTTTTAAAPATTPPTTTRTTTTPRRSTSAHSTKSSYARTTGTPVIADPASETVHSTRAPAHRMRPMRFGNSTRPRFSIKDYKSRLDYRNRMLSTSTETPSSNGRQKGSAGPKHQQQDNEKEPLESTTGRYRHMSRISYRTPSTTPSYQSGRHRDRDSSNSTAERLNKFSPKRRLANNHLYRSKISTSTTTSQPPPGEESGDDAAASTSASTRPNSVRTENVFSAAIRRRPQIKHAVFTQSSDLRTTKKQSTEMVPEETSFYSPVIAQQLLVTEYTTSVMKTTGDETDDYPSFATSQSREYNRVSPTPSLSTEASSPASLLDDDLDNPQTVRSDDTNVFEFTTEATTTSSPANEAGQTEALVKESETTVDAQLEEDLFAKASQSVADLTSSASALYDKPGLFKAVSVAPSTSASETGNSASLINSRFKISQEKQPTLPIEAFFHELSNKN